MDLSSRGYKILSFLGAIMISWLVALSPASGLEIRVKEQAMVRGDTVCLGDIASFSPSDDRRIATLGQIEISSAPSPGNTIRINERLFLYKISSSISDMDDIEINGPKNLLVSRSAQFITAARLEEIFREYVMDRSPWPSEKLVFERISTPGEIALPEGELHWDIQEKRNHNFIGNISLLLDFWVDGRQTRKVPVSGRIRVSQEVVKAARKIVPGELISKEDLMLVTEDRLKPDTNVLTSFEEAIGKTSVRPIQAGNVILSRMIEIPPLVTKGDRVLIKAESDEIRITTMGEVLEDGRSGDQVRVININSGKEISAKVTGPGLVEVYF